MGKKRWVRRKGELVSDRSLSHCRKGQESVRKGNRCPAFLQTTPTHPSPHPPLQFSNYNYSPSWDAYRTVEELRLFTPAAFDQFQAYCYQPAH